MEIRRASGQDAAGIVAVLQVVAGERVFSAIDDIWSIEEERRFIESLSPEETIHVVVAGDGAIVGLQILDRWSPLRSMSHVGQLGTFLLPSYRGQGLGRRLAERTVEFARTAGYRKLVVQVRATNTGALAYYRHLGFDECGRLARQVVIDGREDDEIVMERFL